MYTFFRFTLHPSLPTLPHPRVVHPRIRSRFHIVRVHPGQQPLTFPHPLSPGNPVPVISAPPPRLPRKNPRVVTVVRPAIPAVHTPATVPEIPPNRTIFPFVNVTLTIAVIMTFLQEPTVERILDLHPPRAVLVCTRHGFLPCRAPPGYLGSLIAVSFRQTVQCSLVLIRRFLQPPGADAVPALVTQGGKTPKLCGLSTCLDYGRESRVVNSETSLAAPHLSIVTHHHSPRLIGTRS